MGPIPKRLGDSNSVLFVDMNFTHEKEEMRSIHYYVYQKNHRCGSLVSSRCFKRQRSFMAIWVGLGWVGLGLIWIRLEYF